MGSFVITLREGFEAALIVSLILAYLAKTDHLREHVRSVWLGVAAGGASRLGSRAIPLATGGGIALASVAFIGVAREGVETALFLFASTGESGAVVTMTAGVAGLVAAVVLGVLFYRGALRMNLSRFFLVTSVLIIAFAAFLIFSGVHELGEVTGSGSLELAGPLAALLYGAGFATLYVRDARRPAASRPAEPEPQPETPA